ETDYSIQNSNFFNTSNDVFGNSKPILTLNQNSYLIMPKTITFDDLDSQISYETSGENEVAVIEYYYHGAYVGNATVDLAEDAPASYDFTEKTSTEEPEKETEPNVIIVNIKTVLICILVIALILIIIFVIRSIINSYSFLDGGRSSKRRRRMRKRNRKDGPRFPSSRFNGFDL
ncbi:MAG: D-alanyl-D-alanine carboxypeptidase, partial [Lachnospiraceae bacterium]|nr:D-alanyl-D-alanine carboxypeptidase [Lachnospiraceae bacterium]